MDLKGFTNEVVQLTPAKPEIKQRKLDVCIRKLIIPCSFLMVIQCGYLFDLRVIMPHQIHDWKENLGSFVVFIGLCCVTSYMLINVHLNFIVAVIRTWMSVQILNIPQNRMLIGGGKLFALLLTYFQLTQSIKLPLSEKLERKSSGRFPLPSSTRKRMNFLNE